MPSYTQLLDLIRRGHSPQEIRRRMAMRPSHWRRMLAGKRFHQALKIEEDLSILLAVHHIASSVHGAGERFAELMEAGNPETVRKVCLALLREGLKDHRQKHSGVSKASTEPTGRPWSLLNKTEWKSDEKNKNNHEPHTARTEPTKESKRSDGEHTDAAQTFSQGNKHVII